MTGLEQERYFDPDKTSFYPEAIIVHGSGLMSNPAGRKDWLPGYDRLPKQSYDGRMRITAAGELATRYRGSGVELMIMVTGGNVFPDVAPSVASVMKADLIRRFDVPEDHVILVDKTRNTVSDMQAAMVLLRELGLSNAFVISNDFHLVAKKLAEDNKIVFRTAESILKERDRRYERIIDDLVECSTTKKLIFNQRSGLFLLRIPLIGVRQYVRMAEAQRDSVVTQETDPDGLRKMTSE